MIVKEICHIQKQHLRKNILENQKYGDLKHQLFLFQSQYTGFDALFMEYLTNTRYKVDQEQECDLMALRIMNEMGLLNEGVFGLKEYKATLKVIQDEDVLKRKLKEV